MEQDMRLIKCPLFVVYLPFSSARKAQQSSNAASYASSIESANHRLTKALTPSFAKGISKTPLHASNGKWDDLEEAEAKYEAQRRQLQKEEADLMNEIYEVKDLILIWNN